MEHAGFRFPKMSTPYKYEGDTDAAVKAIAECKLCTSFFLTFVMFLPFKSPFRPYFLSNLPLCLSSFYGRPSFPLYDNLPSSLPFIIFLPSPFPCNLPSLCAFLPSFYNLPSFLPFFLPFFLPYFLPSL